jgi:hypothetical protein
LADILLDSDRAASIDVPRLVDTLPADRLCEASKLLRHVPDSAETVVRIARALEARTPDALTQQHKGTCALAQAIDGLQFRGHLRDARRLALAQEPWRHPSVLYNMARAGMIPADTARAEFRRVLALAPRVRMTTLYRWWATDGDTNAIQTYVTGFETEDHLHTPSGTAMLRASAVAGHAYLALAKRTPRPLYSVSNDLGLTMSVGMRTGCDGSLAAVGRREAARLERRWPGTTGCSNGFDDVLWTMQRARVFEQLGREQRPQRTMRLSPMRGDS